MKGGLYVGLAPCREDGGWWGQLREGRSIGWGGKWGVGYRKAEKWEDDGEAGRVELREEGDLSDWREKKPKIQKPKAGFLWFSLKGGGNGLSVDEFRYRFLCVFYFCKIAPFLCVSCKLLFIGEVWHGHKHIVLSIFIFFIIFWI